MILLNFNSWATPLPLASMREGSGDILFYSIEFDPAQLANFISRRSVASQACFSHQTFFFSWVSRPLSIWHLDNDVSRFTRELLIADKHSYIAHTSMHRMILFSFITFKLIVNLECYCSRNRLYICQSVCSVSSVHMTIHNLFLFVFGCESSPISRNVRTFVSAQMQSKG